MCIVMPIGKNYKVDYMLNFLKIKLCKCVIYRTIVDRKEFLKNIKNYTFEQFGQQCSSIYNFKTSLQHVC
jgi:hypothetical protein